MTWREETDVTVSQNGDRDNDERNDMGSTRNGNRKTRTNSKSVTLRFLTRDGRRARTILQNIILILILPKLFPEQLHAPVAAYHPASVEPGGGVSVVVFLGGAEGEAEDRETGRGGRETGRRNKEIGKREREPSAENGDTKSEYMRVDDR